ncbi:hypothetical protein OS493_040656, partial [Desmophyllum pertusum]
MMGATRCYAATAILMVIYQKCHVDDAQKANEIRQKYFRNTADCDHEPTPIGAFN